MSRWLGLKRKMKRIKELQTSDMSPGLKDTLVEPKTKIIGYKEHKRQYNIF